MKAAIITAPGVTPIYGEFEKPSAKEGEEIISVRAAALTNLTKSRASGAHYSSSGIFPAVVGTDGVGVTPRLLRYAGGPEWCHGRVLRHPRAPVCRDSRHR
jgi:NADPH:quinone reductase-like Zn-dependent oxidoreductase